MADSTFNGRNVVIFTVLAGCIALLWPRVIIPMITPQSPQVDTSSHDISGTRWHSILPCCHPVPFSKELNALFFTELCSQLRARSRHGDAGIAMGLPREPLLDGWSPGLPAWCRDELERACGLRMDESALERYRRAGRSRDDPDTRNLTNCLEVTYGLRREAVRPPKPEQLYSADHGVHPSLRAGMHVREREGVPVHPGQPPAHHGMDRPPRRVIDRMARPGPQPGMPRPTPGGFGAVPQGTKGTGAMGIIMPLYTIGIVVFFVYTIMKVMFKSPESKEPIINDYHMTTAYREYVPRAGAAHVQNGGAPVTRTRPVVTRRQPDVQETVRATVQATVAATPVSTTVLSEDAEIDQLRRRLEETERAMERIMKQMSTVSEKLNVARISSNIKAIKQDLWGSTDSLDSVSEPSISMESLAQTEASLASLEEDVMKAEKAVKSSPKEKRAAQGRSANAKQTKTSPELGARRRHAPVNKT